MIFDFVKKRADYVLLQHEGQRIGCKSIRGNAVLFPNLIRQSDSLVKNLNCRKYFVYVGTLTVLKGTLNLKKLIEQLSDDVAIMIIGEPQDQPSKAVVEELGTKNNLTFTGRLDHATTIEAIANSVALINTSNYEGFPNIFLEAWSNGVPVISLYVNPGNVINKHNLGVFCNGDIKGMKECIEHFDTFNIRPDDLKDYVSSYHSFENAATRFKNVLNNQ
jgi:glycosyltransferase involved in cell wall biosynthesis